jgi:hypothetical protein
VDAELQFKKQLLSQDKSLYKQTNIKLWKQFLSY